MTLTDLAPPLAVPVRSQGLPVAIIGAGPIGLAAAAHLAERDVEFVVLEAGATPASAVEAWGHVRLFSPWSMLVDPAAGRLLRASGWEAPKASGLPTGGDLVRDYLAPLAALPQLAPHIRLGARVTDVARLGMDRTRSADRASTPFLLRVVRGGHVQELIARAVIDASGTFGTPNPLGSAGLDPLGLDAVREHVAPALPDVLGRDRERFAARTTVVVGAGHSAANTLIHLAELARTAPGAEVIWVIRNREAVRVRTSDEGGLVARASLGSNVDRLVHEGRIRKVTGFEIVRLEPSAGRVRLIGRQGDGLAELDADVIVNATGFRPDLQILREVRLDLDEIVEAPRRLARLIDPNVHTCGTVEPHGVAELIQPEPDFFIVGMKSYGRAPTFLLATGHEQVRSVVARLAGDATASQSVELQL